MGCDTGYWMGAFYVEKPFILGDWGLGTGVLEKDWIFLIFSLTYGRRYVSFKSMKACRPKLAMYAVNSGAEIPSRWTTGFPLREFRLLNLQQHCKGDKMKQRNRTLRKNRPPAWLVDWMEEYQAWAEGTIEDWAATTDNEAVVEFKNRRGYSPRRSVTSWLSCLRADWVLERAGRMVG